MKHNQIPDLRKYGLRFIPQNTDTNFNLVKTNMSLLNCLMCFFFSCLEFY